MRIGERLKIIRTERGLSLRGLAEKCNISHSFLSDIERGKSKPSIDTIKTLSQCLNISISELLKDNEEFKVYALEDIIRNEKLTFDGELLDEEDKKDLLEVIETALKLIRRKKDKPK